MKIFLDTADIKEIKKWVQTGVIDGITTNPSHLAKQGENPKDVVLKICKIMGDHCDVSVEVTQDKPELVYKQAKEIAKLANNVVVKIPCQKKYYPIIKKLVAEGVPLNITLVFTVLQSLMMCKLGVRYISPFIGRWNDIDVDGSDILDDIRYMIDSYEFKTQILAASIRTVRDFNDAVMIGADVVTLPIKVFEKSIEHPLTDRGVDKFNADWKKLGIKKFP